MTVVLYTLDVAKSIDEEHFKLLKYITTLSELYPAFTISSSSLMLISNQPKTISFVTFFIAETNEPI